MGPSRGSATPVASGAANPCRFSPDPRTAVKIAEFYTSLFVKDTNLLDIGFGQGFLLEACRRHGIRAVGVDRDPRLVADATRRGLQAYEGDATALGELPKLDWNAIAATHLIEHLEPDDLIAFLDTCAGLLRSGGRLLLSTPNIADWRVASEYFWLDPTHVRPYPPGAVLALLDPDVWRWEADGYEPVRRGKRWPLLVANRVRFGADFGRSGRWYLLQRR